jgi:FkbM family methyltransferase
MNSESSSRGIKLVGGVWLPAAEQHLVEWMVKRNQIVDGRLTYQLHKLEAALKHVRKFRRAVDVGAHCGLWSMHLAKRFERVEAFEPVKLHRDCFEINVDMTVCTLYPIALGEKERMVSMHTANSSSGDTTVAGAGTIPMQRMDDVLAHAFDVDFIKLDCEGYELFALRGGEELLKRCKPVICVEQKPGKAEQFGLARTGAVEYLQGLGAKVHQEMSGDFIMGW